MSLEKIEEESSFEFEQYITLCEEILKCEDLKIDKINDEAIYRIVISGAYYTAYNHVKEWLEQNYGLTPRIFNTEKKREVNRKNAGVHQIVRDDLADVIAKLPREEKTELKEIPDNLRILFNKRVDSDYKKDKKINFEIARKSIDCSNNIIKKLR